MAVINGTNGADTLTGTSGDDEIYGLGGNDVLIGSAGADKLDGGLGTDTVDYSASGAGINVDLRFAVAGRAGIGGDAEGDILSNIEKIIGTAFNDTFSVDSSTVTFEGGAGDDVYIINGYGGTVIEQVGGGNDEVRTNSGQLSLNANVERLTYTGTGTFVGYGNASDNIITGGTGNDLLSGYGGADQIFGGAGIDTAAYAESTVGVNINLKTGVNSGNAAGDTFTDIEMILGSAFNDTFVADGRAIGFDGGAGMDTVDYSTSAGAINVDIRAGGMAATGGDAQGDTLINIERVVGTGLNDTFTTAMGAITFEGGAGDDVYIMNGGGSSIVEKVGGGNDEIRTGYAVYTMDANIERMTYTGTAAFAGYGNASDNIITGGIGNDLLSGYGGADQIFGGAGIDTAAYAESTVGVNINLKTGVNSGNAAGDTFTDIEMILGSAFNDTFVADGRAIGFDGGAGIDTVDYSTSAGAINLDIRAGGMAATGGDAQGDKLVNIEKVIGTGFNDTFTTAMSQITFEGGAGDDVYIMNGGGSSIVEQVGGGNDEIRTGYALYTMDANIERMTYTGTAAFVGYGNASDNIITGGNGNDTLLGGGGADQFIGGAGIDTVAYDDSAVAVSINLQTGVNSGIAAGDTYVGIEALRGTTLNDIFIGSSSAMAINGALGQDLVSYAQSTSAVTIDLKTNVNAGDATGDTFTGVEIFQGSEFADTLSGSAGSDIFIGGAGADLIDGREGVDSAWYITSASAVNINLQTGVNLGSDAQGDVLLNIERVVGSHFDDTLTGDAAANTFEGGLGNDLIYGGDGGDTLYGGLISQIGPFTLDGIANGPQADMMYGGNGGDLIISAADDRGTFAFGEAGDDNVTVVSGTADGGDGKDTLLGTGNNYQLLGGAGDDQLTLNVKGEAAWNMKSGGFANGGEGNDTYTVNTSKLVTIRDDGVSKGDTLILNNVHSAADLMLARVGNDLYLYDRFDSQAQVPDHGVKLQDWYAGFNTIESFKAANGDVLPINPDAFSMFG